MLDKCHFREVLMISKKQAQHLLLFLRKAKEDIRMLDIYPFHEVLTSPKTQTLHLLLFFMSSKKDIRMLDKKSTLS